MQEMQVRSLGQEDCLEKEMAAHSSVLEWEIPQTEKPGGLQFMGSWKSQTRLSDHNNSNNERCLSENLHGRRRNPGTWLSSFRKAQASLPLFQINFLRAFVFGKGKCFKEDKELACRVWVRPGMVSLSLVSHLCHLRATLHPWLAFQISVVLQARWAKQRHCSSWEITCYEAHSWERVVFKIS